MENEVEQLTDEFLARFLSTPRFFQAPGRVNLIGEHTDYNQGFVMPFAIDRRVLVAASVRPDTQLNIYARDLDESATIDLNDPPVLKRGSWIDYVEGSARCVAERFGVSLRGADLMITSTVPIGSGLSSSAALEVAVGLTLLSLNNVPIDQRALAFAGQDAEHRFVGVRSGIMDQFAAVLSKLGSAMLLDCRSLETDYVPIADNRAVIAVFDTKVKHSLASTEYNKRREECESGVSILQKEVPGLESLRDVTTDMLDKYADLLPEDIYKRCKHVVTENLRTVAAAGAFRDNDFALAGRLMFESHWSLRDDYEVSCPELDCLVETAAEVSGIYGARMTGGGFGGCTVNLVAKDSLGNLKAEILERYSARFGFDPDFYLFHASEGASEITPRGFVKSPTEL